MAEYDAEMMLEETYDIQKIPEELYEEIVDYLEDYASDVLNDEEQKAKEHLMDAYEEKLSQFRIIK